MTWWDGSYKQVEMWSRAVCACSSSLFSLVNAGILNRQKIMFLTLRKEPHICSVADFNWAISWTRQYGDWAPKQHKAESWQQRSQIRLSHQNLESFTIQKPQTVYYKTETIWQWGWRLTGSLYCFWWWSASGVKQPSPQPPYKPHPAAVKETPTTCAPAFTPHRRGCI